jgi:glucan phosphoethanolaminetransferase (alkaline phosphatase superfamily)
MKEFKVWLWILCTILIAIGIIWLPIQTVKYFAEGHIFVSVLFGLLTIADWSFIVYAHYKRIEE